MGENVEVYTSEKEQVEVLRKWWKENGKSVISGLLIGAVAVMGYRYWSDYRHQQAVSASIEYQQLLGELGANKKDAVEKRTAYLISKYGDTPYSTAAALVSAGLEISNGDLTAAQTHLRWVIDHSKTASLKHIARLRLARVLMQDKQFQQALSLLSEVDGEKFAPLYEMLKGDAHIALGDKAAARTAYQHALDNDSLSAQERRLLQMKLDELGAAETS